MADCFRGQANGLCGAAVPGFLFLITATHTGDVNFTIDMLDAPPPLDETCEQVVEASFSVEDAPNDVLFAEWGGRVYPIPLRPGSYRVRYCAWNFQQRQHR